MTLKQVVLDVVERMLDSAKQLSSPASDTLREFAFELKGAAKVTPESVSLEKSSDEIRAAEALVLDRLRRAAKRDTEEPRSVLFEGGPADGIYGMIANQAPVGARVFMDGGTYELTELGKMKFVSL